MGHGDRGWDREGRLGVDIEILIHGGDAKWEGYGTINRDGGGNDMG